ncbi:MAG: DUF533 domain-containing protein [Rhizobiaceae bacterium]
MSLNQLFDQFLGGGQQVPSGIQEAASQRAGNQQADNQQGGLSGILPGGVTNQMLGGLAAGGILGAVIGNKKMRKSATKMAGGAVGLGGAAALGYVAYKAYQNWQGGGSGGVSGGSAPTPPNTPQSAVGSSAAQPVAELAAPIASSPPPVPMQAWQGSTPPNTQPSQADFDAAIQVSAEGTPFQEVLIKAMIAAANADGHIDTKEQFAIFDLIEKMQLEPEDKALVFRTLKNPPDVKTIANSAACLEQASEIYLVSRLAIDPDHPMEWNYLQQLSTELALPAELVTQLEEQLLAHDSSVAPA